MRPSRTGGEQHEEEDPGEEHRRAVIGLEHDEAGDSADYQEVRQEALAEVADAIALLGERMREIEDHDELYELRGLEEERPDRQPAPRTAAREADLGHEHQGQHDDQSNEQRIGETP